MMLGRFFIFIFLLGYLAEAEALTLDDALAAAYEYSPILKAKREELKATDELLMQSFSGLLPSLTLKKTKTDGTLKAYNGNSTNKGGTADSLAIRQNLFRGGTDIARLMSAKYSIEQSRANLLSAEQEFLSNTVKVFLQLKGAEDKYNNAQTMVSDTKKYVEAVEQKFKIGDGTKTDIARAKAAYAGAMANKAQNFSALLSARESLKNLTGIEVGALPNTTEKTSSSDQKLILPQNDNGLKFPKNIDEALAIAIKQNPRAISAESADKASTHAVKADMGTLLPSVDLEYSVENNKHDQIKADESNTKMSHQTNIVVTVPVFDGGTKWSNVRKAKAVNKQKMFEKSQALNDVRLYTISAWTSYESAKEVMRTRKEELEAASIAYQGAQAEEKAGLRSSLDVIIARRESFSSFERYIDSRTDYYLSLYAFKSALGECNAKDLKLKVKIFDPLKNYNNIKWQLIGAY